MDEQPGASVFVFLALAPFLPKPRAGAAGCSVAGMIRRGISSKAAKVKERGDSHSAEAFLVPRRSFVVQRGHGVDAHGTPRRQIAGHKGNEGKQQRRENEGGDIRRLDAI